MTRNYTFADNFWESPKKNGVTVMMERMRGAKQTCERLKHAYEMRALLEEEYGKTLIKIAEKQKPSSMETGSTNQTLLLMQHESQSIADSHLQLANLLRDKVATPLSKLLNKQRSLRKELQSSINRLSNRRKIQIQFVKTAIKRHRAEVAKANALVQQQTSENEKMAIHKMSEPAIKNLQNVYEEAMSDLSQIADEWNIEWQKTCENFEKLEQERLEFIKNNITNYANLIAGCFESEIKACERVNDAAVAIDVDRDLDDFVLQYKSSDVIPTPQEYIKLHTLYENTKRHYVEEDTIRSKDSSNPNDDDNNHDLKKKEESKHIENLMDKFRNHPNEKNDHTEVQDSTKETTATELQEREEDEEEKEENEEEEEENDEVIVEEQPVMMVGRMVVFDSDSDDEDEEDEDEEEEYEDDDVQNNNAAIPDYHQQVQTSSTEKLKQVSFIKQEEQESEDDEKISESKPVFRSHSPPPPLSTSPDDDNEEDEIDKELEKDNDKHHNLHSISQPILVEDEDEDDEDDQVEHSLGKESELALKELLQEMNSKDTRSPIPDIKPTTSFSTPLMLQQDKQQKRRSFGYDKDNMNYHDITRRRLSSIDVNSSIRSNNNGQNRPYHNNNNNNNNYYNNNSMRYHDILSSSSSTIDHQNQFSSPTKHISYLSLSQRQNSPPSAQIIHDRIIGDKNNLTELPTPSQRTRKQSRQYNDSDVALSSSSLSSYPSNSSSSGSYGDTYSQRNKYASRDYHHTKRGQDTSNDQEKISYIDFAVAAYDYVSTEEDEISFKQNDSFGIVSKSETGWWGACLLERGTNKVLQSGIIPSTYVTSVTHNKN